MAAASVSSKEVVEGQVKDARSWIQQKYESFWLYPESHPWRLGQHITLRGVFVGSTFALIGGVPFALLKRRGAIATSVGKIAFRGASIGGVITGLLAAERLHHLDQVGIEDRSYRISYNWGQTMWDYLALDGALITMAIFRRPFGGILPAAAVGIGLGSLIWVDTVIYSLVKKKYLTPS